MKRLILSAAAVAAAFMMEGCAILGNISWNRQQLAQASSHALTAVTLTEAQVVELCKQSTASLDASNTIENGVYAKRLSKLVGGLKLNGMPLNFKVYKTPEVNAFASADGSIRVYTGLMDVMDDDELMAIIGHELGHVANKDVVAAMKAAYLTTAAREVVNAAGTVGVLAQTVVGDLAESYVTAQFSQQQEYAADAYGFQFAIDTGHSPYSMYNALNKLVELAGGEQYSLVQKMFASHPNSKERAKKMKKAADAAVAAKQ